MRDLISRSALKNHIMNYTGMFTDELGFAVSLAQVAMAIDNAPVVDAVEVVRCKDCAFVTPIQTRNFPFPMVIFHCRHGRGYQSGEFSVTSQHGFCSAGKRKMDAEVEGNARDSVQG